MQSPEEINKVLEERLTWKVSERDDQTVAQAIHEGEEIDGIYGLNALGLLDEFWHFLETGHLLECFEELKTEQIERTTVPLIQMVLLYFLKVL